MQELLTPSLLLLQSLKTIFKFFFFYVITNGHTRGKEAHWAPRLT